MSNYDRIAAQIDDAESYADLSAALEQVDALGATHTLAGHPLPNPPMLTIDECNELSERAAQRARALPESHAASNP